MLHPIMHTRQRGIRAWWARQSHDTRQGLWVTVALVLLLLAVRLLIGSGLGRIE